MNDFIDSLNKNIIEIKNRINYLKENYNSKNNKKTISLNLKIKDHLESINDILDEFEIDEVNNFCVNKELQLRVDNNRDIKDIINIFGPYIILYQISTKNQGAARFLPTIQT